MTRQVILRSVPSGLDRRQPLLERSDYSSREGWMTGRVGEVAGGTMAVCCCGPFSLADLLVLVVYKVPAGLCRKAIRRKRHRRLMKEGLTMPRRIKCGGCDERELLHMHPMVTSPMSMVTLETSSSGDEEILELEKEMWGQFYSAGFWRSPSQRREISAVHSSLSTDFVAGVHST